MKRKKKEQGQNHKVTDLDALSSIEKVSLGEYA